MSKLPSGTVTFLFTDIEGSSRLWERYPEAMKVTLARHDRLIQQAIGGHSGHIFKRWGDEFCAAFAAAPEALAAALEAQRLLRADPWGETGPLPVRMVLHSGAAEERDGDYFGSTLNRCARLKSVAHGGQTLLTQATYELVHEALPEGAQLRDLGEHRLRDLARPERVFQLLHPDLSANFPPLRSLNSLPNNLPIQLTSFIGRDKEMTEVKKLLQSTRLLTLTGTGGCGKTRLALQVAADSLDGYPEGIWLAELAPLADPELVIQTVVGELGLQTETVGLSPGDARLLDRPLMDQLIEFLQPKKLLLVLDNCEHLIGACARLAEALLRTCPHLRVLATSREGLGIAGEVTYPVPSLTLPDFRQLSVGEADLISTLAQYEAIRLFVERAGAILPTFEMTNQNASAIAQICHRLDGIPLAIELAAARVKVLSVEQIARRLDDAFRLLTGGSRTALPRQQTLQAAMDWGYNLLSEPERALFRRLSVFAGGWTLEAAEALCNDKRETALWRFSESEVLDLLTNLVSKSLVTVEDQGEERRYRLLETVRQYGRDKLLNSGEVENARRRHRNFFLELAERAEPEVQGPDQQVWLERLEREHDNLRTALEWSVGVGEADVALRLAAALWWFWHVRGYWSEGRRWLEEALAKGQEAAAIERAKVLNGIGVLAWRQGDYGDATRALEASLALYREADNQRGIAYAINVLGLVAHHQGDDDRARNLLEESLARFRELGDKRGIAYALNILGLVAQRSGDYSRAAALCDESLALRRELGDKRGVALTLCFLGMLILHYGNHELSSTMFQESLDLFQELGDSWGTAESLGNLATASWFQGNQQQAEALFKESLALRWELGDKPGLARCLEGLAWVAGVQRQYERAARLIGAAENLRATIDAPIPPAERAEYEQNLAAIRAELGPEAYLAAYAAGQAMPLKQTIAYALGEKSE
jgi:predicted ATPase/class 3 adenylate cyclase